MGAWGTAIFDNDDGLDLRGDFDDQVAGGQSVDEALEELEERLEAEDVPRGPFPNGLSDHEWLGLAALQVEHGRVTPGVLARTRSIVASEEEEPERWPEELLPERLGVLADLARRQQEADRAAPPSFRRRVRRRARWMRRRLAPSHPAPVLPLWARLVLFGLLAVGLFLVLRALLPGVTSAGNPPLIAYAYYVFHCVRGALAERRQ